MVLVLTASGFVVSPIGLLPLEKWDKNPKPQLSRYAAWFCSGHDVYWALFFMGQNANKMRETTQQVFAESQVIETYEKREQIRDAFALLSRVLKSKVTDGFGVTEQPVAALIQAARGGNRNRGFSEQMALKLEAGMTITRRRPTRSSGATGDWLVIVTEIMAIELLGLSHDEWKIEDYGGILSRIPGSILTRVPGKVNGKKQATTTPGRKPARVEYLGVIEERETISIPLADLESRFPELKPKPVEQPKIRPTPQAAAKPAKVRDFRPQVLTPHQRGQIRRKRSQGYTAKTLAAEYGVSTIDIFRAANPVSKKVR